MKWHCVVDIMAKETKKNKWTNDEKWIAFLAPLNEWMKAFKPANDDDEDRIASTELTIRRGNRDANKRSDMVAQLKTEYSAEGFEGWSVERLDKAITDNMTLKADGNRQVWIDFFNNYTGVLTYTKDSKKYAYRDGEQFADRKHSSDMTSFKALHKDGLNWESPTFPQEVVPDAS